MEDSMKNSSSDNGYKVFKHHNKFAKNTICFFLFFVLTSCNAQTHKEQVGQTEKIKGTEQVDSLNKPKIDVKVNKQYDKNGKMIKYDSTYSYVYSGKSGKNMRADNDSIFNQFRSYFNINSSDLFEKHNQNIFFNDSLFKYDFFNDDYFQKRFELNKDMFSQFFWQMDSLKGSFLKDNYPRQHIKKK
ncbi:MAG: hypothetical protein JNJ41_19905 [Bacteroidia bacterium]|nr:hypothetical protein [Bacteroidia bacterium]